ncbi:hypothetical protein [Chitinophaga agri]|uniref:Uncharacterized protein n=1 Tax=Chitinophaga agri TaxID=2703787 RepID=A0A6B9ZMR7_9BACT|nr:hypothetical protein [Chitinophaga agri]QHS63542.1 hypothetical protein GWR21_29355 [Chitinophaga agri]
MCRFIERIAADKGMLTEDVQCIVTAVTGYLVKKVPALEQVIEDVFEDAGEDLLNDHIGKMIISIQRDQWKEKFKDFLVYPVGK